MDVDRAAILERIRTVASEVLHVAPGKITEQSTLVSDLGADSLDRLSLLMSLEEEFGEAISDEAAATFTTVGVVVDFVAGSLSSSAKTA